MCTIEALPLHNDASHDLDSKCVDPSAEQCSPPNSGAGELQALLLLRVPMLHEAEHTPQVGQLLHPP